MAVCIYMCKCMSAVCVCVVGIWVCASVHVSVCVGYVYVCLAQATLLGSQPLREDQYCV